MKKHGYILIFAVLGFLAQQVSGQDWLVPPDQSLIENPIPYTLENVKAGQEIYNRNCMSCHGSPGKNNPLALVPLPVDIASEQMHRNSEGDMFYKITTGRGVMPPFEATLSETERWQVIKYMLNYKPGGTALLIDAPPVKAKLLASVNTESRTVEVLAEAEDGGRELAEVPVVISARKTFGNIEIGRTKTNSAGRAEFIIPEALIGDEQGNVRIVVSVGDGFESQAVALDEARVGKEKTIERIIRPEVLWSTNDNVQIWLLVSYLLAAVGSWLVIGYIIAQLVKIKRYGKTA